MSDVEFSLEGISLAVNNMKAMVKFYNTVFGASLQPMPMGEHVLYRGCMSGFKLTLTPSEMIGIYRDNKARYQLSFIVSNLEEATLLASNAGGSQLHEIFEDTEQRYCAFTDPDGNVIELVQPLK